MMYQDKMALAVKVGGRVLREFDGKVKLPFGCEYSLMLKNMNSVKAVAKIWIDGSDVTEGTGGLIIDANSSIDIERFIKNGNMMTGNRFKFIERTGAVSNHRGNKIDDGLIRVEFEYGQQPRPQPRVDPIWSSTTTTTYTKGGGFIGNASGSNASSDAYETHSYYGSAASASGGSAFTSQGPVLRSRGMSSSEVKTKSTKTSIPRETDVGVTVPGSVSDQEFTYGAWFAKDGVKHVMVLQMLGEMEGEAIPVPITVQMKPECTSCGKVNNPSSKFCTECGTSLETIGSYV